MGPIFFFLGRRFPGVVIGLFYCVSLVKVLVIEGSYTFSLITNIENYQTVTLGIKLRFLFSMQFKIDKISKF